VDVGIYLRQVTVIEARACHGVTRHTAEEGGLRVAYEVTVEVEAVTQIVRGGAWKACLDARCQLQGPGLGEPGRENPYAA